MRVRRVGLSRGLTALGGVAVALLAFAAALLLGADADDATAASAAAAPSASGLREIAKLRTRSSDTFRTAAGKMVTRVYAGDVNFKDANGSYEPVDNTLRANADGTVDNAANGYDVTLPKALDAPVSVSDGGAGVSFRLVGASGARSVSGAQATYSDALAGVDVRYTAAADSVKEQLLLVDAGATRHFGFTLDPSSGLTPKVNASGGVDFRRVDGSRAFSFAPPSMRDAKGATSTDLRYRLEDAERAGQWTLELDADSPWLEKSGRAFPVDVDPTVNFDDDLDTYVVDGDQADVQYGPVSFTSVSTGGDHVRRALLHFNLPNIPQDATVDSAQLHLHTAGVGSGSPIEAHALTHTYSYLATWNTSDGTSAWATPGGDYDKSALDTVAVGADGWYSWEVGNAAVGWVSGARPNDGIVLKAPTESTGTNGRGASFDGRQNGSTTPYLTVTWEYPTGVMPQWTFDSYRINDRSSLKVNVATGAAVFQADDVHVAGVGGEDLDLARTYDDHGLWGDSFSFQWALSGGSDAWSEHYDKGNAIMVHAPGARLWRFPKRYTAAGAWDGTWVTPPGVNATLSQDSSGVTLRFNRTGESWFFDNAAAHNGANLRWMQDRNGHRITFDYDSSGWTTSVTDTQGRTYTFTRDPSTHEVTKITDAGYPGGARTWQYGYSSDVDAANVGQRLLRTYTDPNGKVTHYDYSTLDDDLSVITDPRGNKIRISYQLDSHGSPKVTAVTRVTNAGAGSGPTTTYSYDTTAHTTTVTDPDGNATGATASQHQTKFTWDPTTDEVKSVSNQIGEQTSTTYSPNGDVASRTGQSQSTSGQAPTVFGHDGNDNRTSESDPVTASTSETATARFDTGTSSATGGGQTDHQYLETQSVDQSGGKRFYSYDAAGNVSKVGDAATSPANKADLAYTTGTETGTPPKGLVKTSTDGNGNATAYLYYGSADGTRAGDLKEIQPPLVGSQHPGDQTFTYDAESRVATSKDAIGNTTSYTYDALDRVKTETIGSKTYTYTYDENGNLTGRSDGTNVSSFGFDALNRRTSETVAGSSKTYGYDDSSNMTSLTDAWGTTAYGYFADDRVKTITDPAGKVISYAYDDAAIPRTQTITYPAGTSGTLTSSFDLSGKPTVIDAKAPSGTTERKLAYSYLPNGANAGELIGEEDEFDNGASSPATGWKYRYDPLRRLCEATTATLTGSACPGFSGGPAPTAGVYEYSYDNASNRRFEASAPRRPTTAMTRPTSCAGARRAR